MAVVETEIKEDELLASWEKYREFEKLSLKTGSDLRGFIQEWEAKMRTAFKAGCWYSDLVLVFKLLEKTNLPISEITVILRQLSCTSNQKSLLSQTLSQLCQHADKVYSIPQKREENKHSEGTVDQKSEMISYPPNLHHLDQLEDNLANFVKSELSPVGNGISFEKDIAAQSKFKSGKKRGRRHSCEFCAASFTSEKRLTTHKLRKHCDAIKTEVPTINNKGSEVEIKVEEENNIKCDTNDKDDRLYDDSPVSDDGDCQCDICGKAYKSISAKNQHLKAHYPDRSYVCESCPRAFAHHHLLKRHLLVHTGEKPWPCAHCGKAFSRKAALSEHVRVHTGEKPFVCVTCGKSFSRATNYRWHLKLHDDNRPFKCEYCGKAFKSQGNLTGHIRIHTGEKPYTCPECGKAFRDSSTCTYHRRSHASDKQYQCEYCSQSFVRPGTLITHLRTHTGEKRFTCEVCKRPFSAKSSMLRHMIVHAKEPAARSKLDPAFDGDATDDVVQKNAACP